MRLMIVEDEPLLAARLECFCRELLAEQLDAVRLCTLLSEAELRLAESPIDLLLLDLNLHCRDGRRLPVGRTHYRELRGKLG
jgi:two-component system, LytTR family, response regulator LytT